jgi:adhesin transport system outer membrane protein
MNERRTASTLLALGLTAFSSAMVVAQQQNTLKDAAQKAVLSNPEVLQRWHAYQAAINEKDVAFGGYLPRLDLAAGVSRERRDDPVMPNTTYTSRSTTLTLTQMLYDGFATRNEVKRLDHARQVRLFELFDASETAALEASRAYADVLRYRKLVGLAEENYVRHRAVFEQIQKKAQAGVGRRVDLEQASGRLALAEANLLTETANLHDISARYQRLVGDVPGKEMADVPPLAKGLPADAGGLLKATQERSPAIRAAVENVRSADAAADGRKAAYQPRVDLKLTEQRGSDLNGYIGSTNNRTAGVVLSWNLFNGLSDLARSRQYADQVGVAKDLRDKACRDARQTAAIAYDDVRKLTEELGYLDQHQISTEKARDAYRKQFDIGQRTLLDLLDTENELFQARRAYTNAEHDLVIAQARTQAGFGNLLGTLGLSKINQEALPDTANWEAGEDHPEYCPPEAPVLYTVDKTALNARAAQLMKESAVVAPAPVASAAGEREVADALKAWALAWSSRNLQGYLDSYAQTFAPAGGGDRATWAGSRKRAISGAGEIRLDVADIKVAMKDAQHAVTTFRQSYRAANYQDVVAKTLEWHKIDGKWLIVRETSEPLPAQ